MRLKGSSEKGTEHFEPRAGQLAGPGPPPFFLPVVGEHIDVGESGTKDRVVYEAKVDAVGSRG
jgi:hypothetical protein